VTGFFIGFVLHRYGYEYSETLVKSGNVQENRLIKYEII
jgi:hypothetical protein